MQIERATLLRRTLGLSIAAIAKEVGVNRETLREQFVRDGTVPRPQPDVLTSSDLPPTIDAPIDDAIDVDDAGFPASTSSADAPTPAAAPSAAPAPSLEQIRAAWAAGRVADLKDGWATDVAIANPYLGDW